MGHRWIASDLRSRPAWRPCRGCGFHPGGEGRAIVLPPHEIPSRRPVHLPRQRPPARGASHATPPAPRSLPGRPEPAGAASTRLPSPRVREGPHPKLLRRRGAVTTWPAVAHTWPAPISKSSLVRGACWRPAGETLLTVASTGTDCPPPDAPSAGVRPPGAAALGAPIERAARFRGAAALADIRAPIPPPFPPAFGRPARRPKKSRRGRLSRGGPLPPLLDRSGPRVDDPRPESDGVVRPGTVASPSSAWSPRVCRQQKKSAGLFDPGWAAREQWCARPAGLTRSPPTTRKPVLRQEKDRMPVTAQEPHCAFSGLRVGITPRPRADRAQGPGRGVLGVAIKLQGFRGGPAARLLGEPSSHQLRRRGIPVAVALEDPGAGRARAWRGDVLACGHRIRRASFGGRGDPVSGPPPRQPSPCGGTCRGCFQAPPRGDVERQSPPPTGAAQDLSRKPLDYRPCSVVISTLSEAAWSFTLRLPCRGGGRPLGPVLAAAPGHGRTVFPGRSAPWFVRPW